MRYVFDHDLHLHSSLSLCSGDPAETPEAMLEYAKNNQLKQLCLTDHFWDAKIELIGNHGFYGPQNLEYIKKALPLPTADGIEFLFGCETDLDMNGTVGITPETMEELAFIIIPTTHLHMNGFTCRGDESAAERAKLWIDRFDCVLDKDLPFEKVGIAHLTCGLMYPKHPNSEVLSLVSDAEMHRLFAKSAKVGVGIELNFNALGLAEENYANELRPYKIAKDEGCKFYFGSDAHHPKELALEKANAELIIDLLELDESEKFIIR